MTHKEWYQMTAEETLKAQKVESAKQGLASEEALERRKQVGTNELSEGPSISPVTILLNQFKDFMVLVLMGATLISGLLGEFMDAITILIIIVMNGVLGFIQEFRAERSLRALKELSAPFAKVYRDGELKQIPARELVPGDIVSMESGDRVPADMRFLETHSFYVEESALTGESIPVNKHSNVLTFSGVPLGDQRNLGFYGNYG